MRKKKKVKFVLILGDFLRHDFRSYYKKYSHDKSISGYQSFIKKTMRFLTQELQQTFPSIDIYPLIGNNDSDVSDYYINPHGQFFHDTANMWAQLINNKNNQSKLLHEFPANGYYAIDVANQPNLRLIILDTVLFSNQARGKGIDVAANQQLQWLHAQLQTLQAKNQKAIIAMHIPPGIDVYTTLRMRLFRLIELWKPNYTERFQAELKEFAPHILAIFAGHLHSDWFQILTFKDSNDEIPITGVPAISPIFGNNPSFQIYTYSSKSLKLTDYITYYYSLRNKNGWNVEYNFNHIYLSNCDSCSLITGIKNIKKNSSLAYSYKDFYSVKTTSQPISTESNWKFYWCGIYAITAKHYKKCLAEYENLL